MAKVKSIIDLSGTLCDVTFVNSRTYGKHARAKRGTYTPITLAVGMEKSAKVQTEVNQLAKIVFDSARVFVPRFKDGRLWARLLSVFRQQHKAGKAFNYLDFNQMDMRLDYPTSKHGVFRLKKADTEHNMILQCQIAPEKTYLIRLLRIASDKSLLLAYPEEVRQFAVEGDSNLVSVTLNFGVLPDYANTLYVLHCEELIDGMPADVLRCQSVKFLVCD